MPITELRLTRFKCFADSQAIRLKPLTVIYGRNNSGKSTILQSLMLLRQTIDQPRYGGTLTLDGPLHDAGSFSNLSYRHSVSKPIGIKLTIRTDDLRDTEIDLQFTSDEPNPPRLQRMRVTPEGMGPLIVKRGSGRGGPYELSIAGRHLGNENEANFHFSVNSFLPVIGDEPPRVGRPNAKRIKARDGARKAIDALISDLKLMRVLGAFRTAPMRRYEYKGLEAHKLDLTGATTPAVLIHDQIGRQAKKELVDDINTWLAKLANVTLVPLRPARIGRAKLFEIELQEAGHRQNRRSENLADVGFGIGQALPVFVEGLRTPRNGLFIVQEPEIHLHPDAQLVMAQFLVDLISSGRRALVETHSENFLLRIRRSILGIHGTNLSPDDVAILHVDKSKTGSSRVRELALDEFAQQDQWPSDFMQDATRERMDLLQETAQKAEALVGDK